jgi:hypothetical protein
VGRQNGCPTSDPTVHPQAVRTRRLRPRYSRPLIAWPPFPYEGCNTALKSGAKVRKKKRNLRLRSATVMWRSQAPVALQMQRGIGGKGRERYGREINDKGP